MHFVYHTSEVVSALCFDHLASGPSLCLHANNVAVFQRVHGPHGLSVSLLVACASFWCVRRYASTLSLCAKSQVLQHGRLPVVFLQHDAASLGTCSSDCTSDWCVTIFMPADSKEPPAWLRKFSVQTVSYPEKWFNVPRRLSGFVCKVSTRQKLYTCSSFEFCSCLFPPIGFTPTCHTLG